MTSRKSPQSYCMSCAKPCEEIMSCQKCLSGCYCSSECMGKNLNHTQYCPVICSLQKFENEKRMAGEIFASDSEKLPYKMKMKLIRLVGERPLVNIYLDNVAINALWDTGAMVSVINDIFFERTFSTY